MSSAQGFKNNASLNGVLQGSITYNGSLNDGVQLKANLSKEVLRGYSAYQIAVLNGFNGTEAEWLESLRGEDGAAGKDGQDGMPATHSWNGTTLTITSASGTSSANLKGDKGDPGDPGKNGYTPIKGVDYFDGKDGANGKDGYTPIKGVDYFDGAAGSDGKDGYTPVKGKDYFDGKDGEDGYTPVKGIDYFDGKDGADGYTPIKGVDYFTEEEKSEIIDAVSAGLGGGSGVTSWNDITDKPTIPSKTSELTNDSGFLTQHQSLDGYAKTTDHYTKTESDNKYQLKGNYLTSIPEEYVTNTELTAKGYLTSVPSDYAKTADHYTKTESDNKYQGKGNYETAGAAATVQGNLDVYVGANDAAVGANTIAIAAINNEETGILAKAKSYTDEELTFENGITTVNSLGGIAANTSLDGKSALEILDMLLFPYVKQTISNVKGSPNGGTYECGNNQTITSVSATVTKKSKPIAKVELLKGSTVLATQEGDAVKNGGTITFSGLNVAVNSTNVQLTVKAYDTEGSTVTGNTGAFTFVYPYYIGVCAEGAAINEALVEGLTKKVEAKGNKSHAFTTDYQCFVFAYPKAHGVLKSVLDPNNFEILGSFTRHEVSVTGLDGSAQAYYVYVNGASTVSGFTVNFKY